MSYNDYGDEPRRTNRRATREPATPAKIQGSTAAAILVFLAIVGFGIGAIIGNSGGDDPDATTTPTSDDVLSSSPASSDSETDPAEEPEDDPTDNPATAGTGITLTSTEDGGEVPPGENGRINLTGTTDPPLAEIELTVERSLDDGASWTPFGSDPADPFTVETSAQGSFSSSLWTLREGVNQFRVVSADRQAVSNTISVTVVEADDDENDD